MTRRAVIGAFVAAEVAIVAIAVATGSADVVIPGLVLAGIGLLVVLALRPREAADGTARAAALPPRRYHVMMRHRGEWAIWDAEQQTHLEGRFGSQEEAEQAVEVLDERYVSGRAPGR